MESNDPNDYMREWADEAVEAAADNGVVLDYSPASVRNVETVLAELHELNNARAI